MVRLDVMKEEPHSGANTLFREAAVRTANDFITNAVLEESAFCGTHKKQCQWSRFKTVELGGGLVLHVTGSTCFAFSRRSSTK